MRIVILVVVLLAASITADDALKVFRFRRADASVGAEVAVGTGTCKGSCVDIKKNPSCAGYIHIDGACPEGLGCCR